MCHKKEWIYAPDHLKLESFGDGYAQEGEKYILLNQEDLLLPESMDVAQKLAILWESYLNSKIISDIYHFLKMEVLSACASTIFQMDHTFLLLVYIMGKFK